jgi:outer membrane immunogenic protein
MFRKSIASVSAIALVAVAAPALAQTAPTAGAYGTLGYGHVDTRDGGLGTAQGRLGYKFTPNLGVEAEGAFGVDTDAVTSGGVAYDAKVKRSLAAYGVATAPLSDRFEIFGRVGYGNTKFKAAVPGTAFAGDADSDSLNYGAGAQYFFDGRNGVRADWTRHDFRHDQGHADVYGVSYVRRF